MNTQKSVFCEMCQCEVEWCLHLAAEKREREHPSPPPLWTQVVYAKTADEQYAERFCLDIGGDPEEIPEALEMLRAKGLLKGFREREEQRANAAGKTVQAMRRESKKRFRQWKKDRPYCEL
jgi:organic radical activating enzyme